MKFETSHNIGQYKIVFSGAIHVFFILRIETFAKLERFFEYSNGQVTF